MANSPQNDESTSTNNDSLLKRKAISEMRLRDPKLWDIVGWMKSMFIKDMECGVRKVDFYNYVTGHLGRIGYRDVWHILKIAYPHVDRVRRGRKYMYWGIRHVDDKLEHMDSAALNEGENASASGNEKEGVNSDRGKDDEKSGGDSSGDNNNNRIDMSSTSVSNNSGSNGSRFEVSNNKTGNCNSNGNSNDNSNNNNNSNNSIDNKRSSNSSDLINDCNNNNNSSKRIRLNNSVDKESNSNTGENASATDRNIAKTGKTNEEDNDAENSTNNEQESHETSPTVDDKQCVLSTPTSPSVVVKSEQFSDNEEETKPQDFLVMEFKEKDVFESFEDYEKSKGISTVGKNGRSLTPPPSIFTDHPSPPSPEFNVKKGSEMNGEKNGSSFDEQHENQIFSSSLLKPENINKVCIPLIHDAKTQTKKAESAKPTKTGFNPVIVSVESIVGSSTEHRNPIVLSDGKLTDQSQGVDEGELQTVVVQDRGIQVCENANGNSCTQRRLRKRKSKNANCTKDACSNRNEPARRGHMVTTPKPRKRPRKPSDKLSTTVSTTSKPTIPLAPKPMTVNSTQQQRLDTTNVLRVPTLPLPSTSRGYTASSTIASAQGIALLTQALTNAANSNAAAKMTSSTRVMTSRPDANFKRNEISVTRPRHDQLLQFKSNDNNNKNTPITRSLQDLNSRQNTSLTRPAIEQQSDYNREVIRKILEEHESRVNSTANSKDSDLQVMVECLSAEVEKERTMRLRLEIELRKVENQLEQERKLNERLAALLMKR